MAKFKIRRYVIYYFARIGVFILSLLPLKAGLAISEFFGRMISRLLGKYRDIAANNLDSVFSDDHENNRRIAEDVFANIAKNGAEWVKLYSMDPKKLGDIVTEDEGFDKLEKVMAEGKGALVLGFHFGNWELLGMYLRHKNIPGSLVAKRIYFHKYNELLENLRNRFDAPTIYRDESPRKMLKYIKSGNVLGIVPDQDVDSIDGVFVDFFGRPAYTPVAPVKLAMAAKTKIVPIFVVRKEDNTHKLIVEDPIDPLTGVSKEEAPQHYTQQWTSLLEKYVRKYPEQWVWIHKRWKTQEK